MMEIKCKLWDVKRKEMLFPCEGDVIKWHAPSNWKDFYIPLMYTGLKDKNGVEICEGDIIEEIEEHFYSEIYWSEDGLTWMADGEHLGDFKGCDIVVIGNIYENPELLERES